MLEGNMYAGSFGELLKEPLLATPFAATIGGINSVKGGSLLARWTHSYSGGQTTQGQIYYTKEDRGATERPDNLDTVDLDVQHHFHIGSRQDLVGGVGFCFLLVFFPAL